MLIALLDIRYVIHAAGRSIKLHSDCFVRLYMHWQHSDVQPHLINTCEDFKVAYLIVPGHCSFVTTSALTMLIDFGCVYTS